MTDTLFCIFGIFTIAMGLGVVFARNAVYSAFSLILSFFGLSILYVLWNATFVAVLQVLIYAGAIVVLFVFVVMLLNLGNARGIAHSHKALTVTVAGIATWCFALLLLRALNYAPFYSGQPSHTGNTSMRVISKLLFNEYLWPFEVLSLFLLVLMVAIYSIARPDSAEEKK